MWQVGAVLALTFAAALEEFIQNQRVADMAIALAAIKNDR
jgi:hypothetical protein